MDHAPLTALADSTRARIARMLLDAPDRRASVTALADALGVTQPTASHHLARLREAGIVESAKEGRRVWYSLVPSSVDRVESVVSDGDEGLDVDTEVAFQRDRAVDRIAERFRGTHARATVERIFAESIRMLERQGVRARDLGLRAAGFTVTRLEALERASGDLETRFDGRAGSAGAPGPVSVLFVCVRNAGRSQLASAIMRQLAGDLVEVHSAGSAPASDLSSGVVRALAEIGVPVGGEFPKPLTDESVRAADVVVTMGCGDACPVYPGRRYVDWDLPDPAGLPIEDVRRVRDDIEERVRALLAEVVAVPEASL
ncbi:MAG: metalloregulator ArsR/SmtB family transcription factor [Pseudoclavibacter sp.]